MVQDIFPHVYHNEFFKDAPRKTDVILAFTKAGLLCKTEENRVVLPRLQELGWAAEECHPAFAIDDCRYYLWRGEEQPAPEGWSYLSTRPLRDCGADEQLFAMAVGESLRRWYDGNRFCGRCGSPMEDGSTERSRVCPKCGNTVYPKICPAVIVAIHDGNRLVLTRYKGRPFTKYALVAGFNEIGESIEETVHREVMEEVGLKVKNLRFYKSQPWVFTDSLLMGFFAELDGSETITVQEDELSEGAWHERENLPTDHSGISLTGEMIEYFRQHGAI